MWDPIWVVVAVKDDLELQPLEVSQDNELRHEHFYLCHIEATLVNVRFCPTEDHEAPRGFGEILYEGLLLHRLCRLFLLCLLGRWLGDEAF